MKRLLLGLGLMAMSSRSWAVPNELNFQGRLTESGAQVTGTRDMTFRLFNSASGGTALFVEEHHGANAIAVSSGIFNSMIGGLTSAGIPLEVFDGADKYVEVEVAGTVMPRQRIVSVAYAFRSDSASFATKAGSLLEPTTAQPVIINVTQVNVTTISVANIVATSGTVTGSLKVGKHTIILGEDPATGGVPNTIAFENGDAFIKTQDPSAGNLTLEAGANKDIFLGGGGKVGVGTLMPETKVHIDGVVTVGKAGASTGGLRLYNAASALATTIQAGNATVAVVYRLPPSDGEPGQVLTTDGAGNLLWAFVAPPLPTLTSISPSSGSVVGGTAITLAGTGFRSGATVSIAANPATGVVFVNGSQIVANTPAGVAGPQNVRVTNPDGNFTTLIGAFTYVPVPVVLAPIVQTISPNTGLTTGGLTISLNGSDFQNGATVSIGGTAASVNFINSTQLQVVTPPKPEGSYDVVVVNPDGQTATVPNGFTYNAACGGVQYQGACWYLTPNNDGNTAAACQGSFQPRGDGTNIWIAGICDMRGGYNEAATRDIAGSGAPNVSACSALKQILAPEASSCIDGTSDYHGVGCSIWKIVDNFRCRRITDIVTTGPARTGGVQRICACNQ